jgi:hypothetical protein
MIASKVVVMMFIKCYSSARSVQALLKYGSRSPKNLIIRLDSPNNMGLMQCILLHSLRLFYRDVMRPLTTQVLTTLFKVKGTRTLFLIR